MSVRVDPKSLRGDNTIKINRLSEDKAFRISKIQSDVNRELQENLTKKKAGEYGLKYINLYGYPVTSKALDMMPKTEVEDIHLGIFDREEGKVMIAIDTIDSKYLSNQQKKIKELRELDYEIDFYFCSAESMDKLLRSYDLVVENVIINDNIELSKSQVDKIAVEKLDKKNFAILLAGTNNVSEKIQAILGTAAFNKASDIHLESEENTYLVKMRIDGVMIHMATLPSEDRKQIETRVKLLAKLKLNIDNVPQDGRFSFKFADVPLDVRVSMLPSNYGYSIVMRLLGNNNVELNFNSLGFLSYHQNLLDRAMRKNQGLILTCGPTGSGKTTTLYSILSKLNDGESKIITLEDPIEYKISGISQTQIDAEAGVTFASALRSVLRQDPDVIMVGEIRDLETAETAVNAALTGHRVLSTLHTNDAVGALPRMLEMGVKGYLFSDAASIIIGQRLVRSLCDSCKLERPVSDSYEIELLTLEINKIRNNIKLQDYLLTNEINLDSFPTYCAQGCEECNMTGYRGRIGVYEIFDMNPSLKALLQENVTNPSKIRATIEADGFVTMLQDAVIKIIRGETDISEVVRVIN